MTTFNDVYTIVVRTFIKQGDEDLAFTQDPKPYYPINVFYTLEDGYWRFCMLKSPLCMRYNAHSVQMRRLHMPSPDPATETVVAVEASSMDCPGTSRSVPVDLTQDSDSDEDFEDGYQTPDMDRDMVPEADHFMTALSDFVPLDLLEQFSPLDFEFSL